MERSSDVWPIVSVFKTFINQSKTVLCKNLFRSNWNGCERSITCPLATGNYIMKFYLAFSNYQIIINLLKNDTPYQLTYMFTNRDTGDKFVVYAQARCLTEAPTSASKN